MSCTLNLNGGPLVVGTLSSFEGNQPALACDVIEVRLDKTGQPADWLERCQSIEAGGKPVLLTVRGRNEGGEWDAPDELRLNLYQQGLEKLSAVDIELASALVVPLGKLADKLKKVCLVSYHNFQETPSANELESVIHRAHQAGSAAKVSTMVRKEEDVEVLRSLLGKKWEKPLCVIGMGEGWSQTRITFPRLGSCLTYGFLDKPTAPGQLSAAELKANLQLCPN